MKLSPGFSAKVFRKAALISVTGAIPVPSAFARKISDGAVSDARVNTSVLPSGVTCRSPYDPPAVNTGLGAPPAKSTRNTRAAAWSSTVR